MLVFDVSRGEEIVYLIMAPLRNMSQTVKQYGTTEPRVVGVCYNNVIVYHINLVRVWRSLARHRSGSRNP